ncbi:MAG TPA: GAF domain-containing protein [Bacilli bacterium]|nr:GAF domain-containing protein [Bacilli bacterium]
MNKKQHYQLVKESLDALLTDSPTIIASLANTAALLKDEFSSFSWVGFYLLNEGQLQLGPFQGKVACTTIEMGRGVCGTAAAAQKTILVDDVHQFPGHIACDEGSQSEIVLPIVLPNQFFGVLDIDSYRSANFDQEDKQGLEDIVKILVEHL